MAAFAVPEAAVKTLVDAVTHPPNAQTVDNVKTVLSRTKHNVVASALLLVSAVACDALTAQDPTRDPEADPFTEARSSPTSLRTSSLVAIAIVAAPAVTASSASDDEKAQNTAWQRVVVALFLLTPLALLGEHCQSKDMRLADTYYITLCLCAAVWFCAQGGIETAATRPDDITSTAHPRQCVAGLSAALMLYVAMRGCRAAFVMPMAAADMRILLSADDGGDGDGGDGGWVTTPFYAFASADVVVPLSFGHGLLLALGAIVITSKRVFDDCCARSAALAAESATLGGAMAAAALWALVRGRAETRTALEALYGMREFSTASGHELVDAHARVRRFADTAACTSSLWLAAQASIVFASAAYSSAFVTTKAAPRGQNQVKRRLLSLQLAVYENTAGITAAAVALLVVFFVIRPFDAPAGIGAAPDTETVFAVSIIAALVGTTGDAVGRCFAWALYAAASVNLWADEWQSAETRQSNDLGVDLELHVPTAFDDPATTSAVAVAVAFAVAAFSIVANLVLTFCGLRVASTLRAVEHQAARCAESVAFLLFGFGAVRLADSDGSGATGTLHGARSPGVYPTRDAIVYAFVHFVPFIVASSTRHSNVDDDVSAHGRVGWRLGCLIPLAAAAWALASGTVGTDLDASLAAWTAAAPVAFAWLVEALR